jgi:hypothetical protein
LLQPTKLSNTKPARTMMEIRLLIVLFLSTRLEIK